MSIKPLSDSLVSKIAAGEVVERPYSVVKELVENSLDAGAKHVAVELLRGGVKRIRVVDDGGGVAADEIDLAFTRFATSKMSDLNQLDDIKTLGFRGEALPAIASVSEVEMLTRRSDAPHGVLYSIAYGVKKVCKPMGAPVGTTVTADNLFYKTPARLKFLSTANYEAARVHQLIGALALINPEIGFKLVADDKPRFNSIGASDYMTAVMSVYSTQIAEAMLLIDAGDGLNIKVRGVISAPNIRRRNRSGITLAVNGRLIQDRMLLAAVKQAYRGYLGEHDFPIAALNVILKPSDVDVNVHPAKAEVRFANRDTVFSALRRAVKRTLTEKAGVPTIGGFGAQAVGGDAARIGEPSQAAEASAEEEWRPSAPSGANANSPGANANQSAPPPSVTHRDILPAMKFIGQVQNTYLIADTVSGVFFIDQHAAHERVTFDRLTAALNSRGALELQQLMDPISVELSAELSAFADNLNPKLERLGFQLERFGERILLARCVPAMLLQRQSVNIPKLIIEILETALNDGDEERWRRHILATMACHSSIRAGHSLTAEEGQKLIEQLAKTKQPQTCPHGRPTVLHLTGNLIEKEFGRR